MTRCTTSCQTDTADTGCTCGRSSPALDAELRRVHRTRISSVNDILPDGRTVPARHVRHELVTDSAGRVSLRIDDIGGEPVFGEPV